MAGAGWRSVSARASTRWSGRATRRSGGLSNSAAAGSAAAQAIVHSPIAPFWPCEDGSGQCGIADCAAAGPCIGEASAGAMPRGISNSEANSIILAIKIGTSRT